MGGSEYRVNGFSRKNRLSIVLCVNGDLGFAVAQYDLGALEGFGGRERRIAFFVGEKVDGVDDVDEP